MVADLRDARYVEEQERDDYRTPTQIDRDRLLYSTSFARLAEVTQVVSADRGHVFHNRLTHSLKVAQLARRLSEKLLAEQPEVAGALGGIDPDAAEAAALAHDLGHPPYGHIAETEIDKVARAAGLTDGFEGNAQSFRIVCKLAVSDAVPREDASAIRGLNLTRRTLNGILKYPWFCDQNSKKPLKWGSYETERDIFGWTRELTPPSGFAKSAEAEIMDYADDITYAVHDVTDFLRAGQIPFDALRRGGSEGGELSEFYREVFARCKDLKERQSSLERSLNGVIDLLPLDRRYEGTLEQREDLWQYTTVLISEYVRSIKLVKMATDDLPCVEIVARALDEIRMLKELTWHYVILNTDLVTVQHGQKRIVRETLNIMIEAASDEKQWNLFPGAYRGELEAASNGPNGEQETLRIAVDYVAGMTETELIKTYDALTAGT